MNNHSITNRMQYPLNQEKSSCIEMNETVDFLNKINKLNESSMKIEVKSRFNLIRKEKERLASIDNKEKKVYKSSRKDQINYELTALFNRFKEIGDYSFSIIDSEPNPFYTSKKPLPLFNNKSIKEEVLKNDKYKKDLLYSDNSSISSLRALKNNILSKVKKASNKAVKYNLIKSKKKFFSTEILEEIKKNENNNSQYNCEVKTFFPKIKDYENIKYKSHFNINPFKFKENSVPRINKGDSDIFTRSVIKPKELNTVVKFHNFPHNFPNSRKDHYRKINLDHVFSVLKVYKPEFKF